MSTKSMEWKYNGIYQSNDYSWNILLGYNMKIIYLVGWNINFQGKSTGRNIFQVEQNEQISSW